jgi:poly-gamma-glutamate synthesis protein (capsule biosynthesis protein)
MLDFGRQGLLDTLSKLGSLRIKVAGAGRDASEAGAPALIDFGGKGRVLVWSFATTTSGVPRSWDATPEHAGINLLPDLSEGTIARICDQIGLLRQPGDVIVISLHWGPNWGYDVPNEHVRFAHALIDRADVSIVHGHSSHHAMALEVYRKRLVLYGCGDFLNDYEGIEGYEDYRDDLVLMYVADVDALSSDVVAVEAVPFQLRRFQLVHPSASDVHWLQQTLDRESRTYGTRLALTADGRLHAHTDEAGTVNRTR